MARKLKSDKVLFTATLLLVCSSIVMVYSASALVALERFQQPYLFVTKQALWAVLGLAVLAVAMRVDYRTYRNEAFIWGLLASSGCCSWACFSAAGQRHAALVWRGRLGIQPSELAKIACVLFTALMLERRMHRINDLPYSLLPIGIVVGGLVGLILLQPDFGTSMSLLLVVAMMIFAAGLHYAISSARCSAPCPCSTSCSSARRTAAAGCWRSGIRGPIRSATASRSSSR